MTAQSAVSAINHRLDRAIGLHVAVRGRRVGSWQAVFVAAFLTAVGVWTVLARPLGMPPVGVATAPLVVFTLCALRRRHVLRSGRFMPLVLHREVAYISAVLVPLYAAAGWLDGQVLDAAAVAVLVGVSVGRIGCFRSGCCIGRQSALGVVYPWLSPAARRCPVQLLDSAACAMLATLTLLVSSHASPGNAAVLGVGGYLLVRLLLDELRDARVGSRALTEAQRVVIVAALLGALFGVTAMVV